MISLGGVLRIADLLQYVPMLCGLAVCIDLEDVNAGKSRGPADCR
jgi:hypothetical protein